MKFVHSDRIIDAIAAAMREQDYELGNDIEPFDYYTEKARVAAATYDQYQYAPRTKPDCVEGIGYYRELED